MAKPTNQKLYDRIKAKVYKDNPKHSAYRSGQIVKQYKAAGGTYEGKKTDTKGLGRWYKEEWKTEKGKKTYKEGGTIFRPTKRITKDTPKTMGELSKKDKEKAIEEKKKKGRVKKY
tara:strand:+ start:1206 stop:1553 length:348 start_codon:yes stop_codon:yes gene_type:complete